VRTPLLLAAALAASVAVPAVSRAGTNGQAPSSNLVAANGGGFGLRRGIGGKGLSLRQPLTAQSALAVTASNGTRKELPEVRVIFGLTYSF
jgi:hypothetical protein